MSAGAPRRMGYNSISLFHGGIGDMIPEEIFESLQNVFFMHQVAIEPESVLPPGQSLMTMHKAAEKAQWQRAHAKKKSPGDFVDRYQDAKHKKFWNESKKALSSPIPSVQLERLKLLYSNLGDAVILLLPKDHKLGKTLRAPLAPTTSPLTSTMNMLKELLPALRGRCAPARVHLVDELYTKLDEWSEHGHQTKQEAHVSLALLIADTMSGAVALADTMNEDLTAASMGLIQEQDVKPMAVMLAKTNERDAILNLWGAKTDKGRALREQWTSWNQPLSETDESVLGASNPKAQWVVRLVKQLAMNVGVSCDWPSSIGEIKIFSVPTGPNAQINSLPPHFLFVAPKLLQLQSRLQAITIAASLRVLARLPNARNASSDGQDLTERIWALLEGEMDTANGGVGAIKIINLADEVIRARRLSSPPGNISAEEETRLRADVERTLRPSDPVFRLMHRRLCDGVTTQILDVLSGTTPIGAGLTAPKKMSTGRTTDGHPDPRRPTAMPDLGVPNTVLYARSATATVVKGFEHPILFKAVQDVFRELLQRVTWIEYVWEDVIMTAA